MSINICYGVNEKYSLYAYVSLYSLLKNKSNNKVVCHLIGPKNNKYLPWFLNLQKNLKNIHIIYHEINDNFIKDIPTQLPHLDTAAFYRLFVDKFINTDKILYIDADTLINDDISSIFKIKIGDNIIGACTEYDTTNIKKILNITHENYFNSGVMLIDIKKWGKYQIGKTAIELLRNNRYPNDDQDALNIILGGKCDYLDIKYNYVSQYYQDKKKNSFIKPCIIHFTGSAKPRNIFSIHPETINYNKLMLESLRFNGEFLDSKEYIRNYLIMILHKIIFFIFPSYRIRQKISNFVHKFL